MAGPFDQYDYEEKLLMGLYMSSSPPWISSISASPRRLQKTFTHKFSIDVVSAIGLIDTLRPEVLALLYMEPGSAHML
jgi:hypothetical protein